MIYKNTQKYWLVCLVNEGHMDHLEALLYGELLGSRTCFAVEYGIIAALKGVIGNILYGRGHLDTAQGLAAGKGLAAYDQIGRAHV